MTTLKIFLSFAVLTVSFALVGCGAANYGFSSGTGMDAFKAVEDANGQPVITVPEAPALPKGPDGSEKPPADDTGTYENPPIVVGPGPGQDPSNPGDEDKPIDDFIPPQAEPPAHVEPDPDDRPGDGDRDNDGIPDDQDGFPQACTNMQVIARGVSSARVLLNGETIFGPSSFHNRDVTLSRNVNLLRGSNVLEVRLAGSPGDSLTVRIFNCTENPVLLLYERSFVRGRGSPTSERVPF